MSKRKATRKRASQRKKEEDVTESPRVDSKQLDADFDRAALGLVRLAARRKRVARFRRWFIIVVVVAVVGTVAYLLRSYLPMDEIDSVLDRARRMIGLETTAE